MCALSLMELAFRRPIRRSEPFRAVPPCGERRERPERTVEKATSDAVEARGPSWS